MANNKRIHPRINGATPQDSRERLRKRLRGSGDSGTSGAYDAISNVVFGVSIRLLNGSYSGSCLRIRRSSDNAEQDIGFSGTSWDTAAMESFCGAGDGFVVTWYDQYGSINPTQATAGNQPQVVASGTTVADGPDFVAASSQYLEVGGTMPVTAAPLTMVGWAQPDNITAQQTIGWLGDKDVANHYWALFAYGTNNDECAWFPRAGSGPVVSTSTAYVAGTTYSWAGVSASATDHRAYLNAAGKGSSSTSSAPLNVDRLSIGRDGDSSPSSYWDGHIAELVITSDGKADGGISTIHAIGDPTA